VIRGRRRPGRHGQIVALEAELFEKRQKRKLRHLNENGEVAEATLGALATNMAANPDEAARESSLSALRGLEEWISTMASSR